METVCNDPNEIHRLFMIRLLKDDLKGALDLYHPEALFVPGPGKEAVSGREAIAEQLRSFMQIAPRMKLVDRSVYQASDTCFVAMRWRLEGGDPDRIHTAMDVIKRNPEGSWQFLLDNPFGV